MESSDLRDRQWERLRPLLPPQKPRTGRPANDNRTILNGLLWILRTGSP
jgi:transposase